MTHLRRFCAATILTLTFALATFGGDMQCGVVAPPPDPPGAVIAETTPGDTAETEESTETSFIDPVTEFTLNILQGLLALF